MHLLSSADFFKKFFRDHYQNVKRFLGPDQARLSVGPDLGPNFKDYQQMTNVAASKERLPNYSGKACTNKNVPVLEEQSDQGLFVCFL